MERFFEDFSKQAKGLMYEVEAAVVNLTKPTGKKRATATVRQTKFLHTPEDLEERALKDEMIGTWYYGDNKSYRILRSNGKFIFREGKRKGELVPGAEENTWVTTLSMVSSGKEIGNLTLWMKDDTLVSVYRSKRTGTCGEEVVATKEEPKPTECSQARCVSRSSLPKGCQRSKCLSADGAEEDSEVKQRKHANACLPQELHFVAPQDAVAGQPVCLQGPHGDPIMVPLPEGAEPGKPSSVYLGPSANFLVVVPEDAAPGHVVIFKTENGEELHTVVPPGKMPGDTLEIVPPVALIQVPHGVKSGEEVIYTTPQGIQAIVKVPPGYTPGNYFATLLPVPPELREIVLRQVKGPSETKDNSAGEAKSAEELKDPPLVAPAGEECEQPEPEDPIGSMSPGEDAPLLQLECSVDIDTFEPDSVATPQRKSTDRTKMAI